MKFLTVVLTLFLFVPCLADQADQSWVKNGRLEARLVKVDYLNSHDELAAMPWNSDFKGKKYEKLMTYSQKTLFRKEKKVALITFDLKNSSLAPLKVGARRPGWMVRCDDGQQISNGHSFACSIIYNSKPGFPSEETLAPGQTVRRTLAFFIPNFTEVNILFFKSAGRVAQDLGESESLVLRLKKQRVTGGKAVVGKSDSKQPWQSNKGWKMRITGSSYVSDMKSYRKLDWNERMTGDAKDKNLKYMTHFFGKKKKRKKVALLDMEIKNLHGDKQKVGVNRPYWVAHLSDGTKISNNHSYMRQVSFLLKGGLPRETKLNSKATVRGTLAFFIPVGTTIEKVSYNSQGLLKRSFGESGNLVMPVPSPGK